MDKLKLLDIKIACHQLRAEKPIVNFEIFIIFLWLFTLHFHYTYIHTPYRRKKKLPNCRSTGLSGNRCRCINQSIIGQTGISVDYTERYIVVIKVEWSVLELLNWRFIWLVNLIDLKVVKIWNIFEDFLAVFLSLKKFCRLYSTWKCLNVVFRNAVFLGKWISPFLPLHCQLAIKSKLK